MTAPGGKEGSKGGNPAGSGVAGDMGAAAACTAPRLIYQHLLREGQAEGVG